MPDAPNNATCFPEAMARLASGLAVVTARGVAGPRGLLVSSICGYSANPASVLVSIDRASRSHVTLMRCGRFGVHLLANNQAGLARRFGSRVADKFAGLDWVWDDSVPRLQGVLVYLRCATRRVFKEGDHAIIIGDVACGEIRPGEPLVYYRRRFDWCLCVPELASRSG